MMNKNKKEWGEKKGGERICGGFRGREEEEKKESDKEKGRHDTLKESFPFPRYKLLGLQSTGKSQSEGNEQISGTLCIPALGSILASICFFFLLLFCLIGLCSSLICFCCDLFVFVIHYSASILPYLCFFFS